MAATPMPSARRLRHYEVRDPALRSEILQVRSDPTANGHGGAFTKANAGVSQRLGQPSEGELYIAHFLGAGGAARLITLASAHPNAKAAHFFASAAQANSPISYDRATGAARSVAQCAMSSLPATTSRAAVRIAKR